MNDMKVISCTKEIAEEMLRWKQARLLDKHPVQ